MSNLMFEARNNTDGRTIWYSYIFNYTKHLHASVELLHNFYKINVYAYIDWLNNLREDESSAIQTICTCKASKIK